ncbi:hypothetical protein Tco_0322858 [Tanacetum coccineum]
MDSFQGLTTKSPSSWHRSLASDPNFYDHVSFHLKYEIDRTAGGKLRDKNTDESWEIIENLAFYDHEGWNDTKEFVKPVKAISTPQPTSKTPDRRLLELEDQIKFLLKGSQSTPEPSSTQVPQAYTEAINDRMTETFRLLKELATNRAPEKVLIREEAKFPVTKNANSISLTRGEEERSEKTNITTGDNFEKPTKTETEMPVKEAVKEDESKNEKS